MAPSKNDKSAAGINGRVVGFGLLLELTRGAPSRNHRVTVWSRAIGGCCVSWPEPFEGSGTRRKVGFVTMALVWENVWCSWIALRGIHCCYVRRRGREVSKSMGVRIVWSWSWKRESQFFFFLHCRASTRHSRSTTGNPQ